MPKRTRLDFNDGKELTIETNLCYHRSTMENCAQETEHIILESMEIESQGSPHKLFKTMSPRDRNSSNISTVQTENNVGPLSGSNQCNVQAYHHYFLSKKNNIKKSLFQRRIQLDNKENDNTDITQRSFPCVGEKENKVSNLGCCTSKKVLTEISGNITARRNSEPISLTQSGGGGALNPQHRRISSLKKEETEDCSMLSPGTPCSPNPFDNLLGIPTIEYAHNPDCQSISPQTLLSLVKGEYKDIVNEYIIIDCRFPFEYNGGHIKGAINLYEPSSIVQRFFEKPKKNTIIVFHCEFSQKRAPKMYRYLRQLDRKYHEDSYPELYYPNIYILEGGYKQFFQNEDCRLVCTPKEYIPMNDERFSNECKTNFSFVSQQWKKEKMKSNPKNRPRRVRTII